jgi:hypothetical protein
MTRHGQPAPPSSRNEELGAPPRDDRLGRREAGGGEVVSEARGELAQRPDAAAVAGGRRVGVGGIVAVVVAVERAAGLQNVRVAVLKERIDALIAVDDAVIVVVLVRVSGNEGGRANAVLAVEPNDDVGVEFGVVAAKVLRAGVGVKVAVSAGRASVRARALLLTILNPDAS